MRVAEQHHVHRTIRDGDALSRLFEGDQVREQVAVALDEILNPHGTFTMRFTPADIRVESEVIVRPFVPPPGVDPPPPDPDELPCGVAEDAICEVRLLPIARLRLLRSLTSPP